VALTANALEEDRQACLDAGMDDYIAKPVSESAITVVLERYYGPGQDVGKLPAPKILIIGSEQALVYRIKRASLRFFPGALVRTCTDAVDGALAIASELPGLVFLPSSTANLDVLHLRGRLAQNPRYRHIKLIAVCSAQDDPISVARDLDVCAAVPHNYEEADFYDLFERIFNDPTNRAGFAIELASEAPEREPSAPDDAEDGVLDPRPIVRMLGTDLVLINEFVDIFLKDLPEQIDYLEHSLDDGDLVEVGKRAHRIKGASIDVGGQRVHLAALELEQAAKREDRAVCVRKLVELRKEMDRLIARLKSIAWDKISVN
jgi:CheY-like chemotaxis protein/HPt (histidine-containing phosphotransfer) domain-containing protein